MNHELAKLSRKDIEEIREKFHVRKNEILVDLAEEYGVTHNAIWEIVIRPIINRYTRKNAK